MNGADLGLVLGIWRVMRVVACAAMLLPIAVLLLGELERRFDDNYWLFKKRG